MMTKKEFQHIVRGWATSEVVDESLSLEDVKKFDPKFAQLLSAYLSAVQQVIEYADTKVEPNDG